MKKLLFAAVLVAGCVPLSAMDPFRAYIGDDGSRTWYFEIRDEFRRHLHETTDDEIIARAHAESGFCADGYIIDRSERATDMVRYWGRCY